MSSFVSSSSHPHQPTIKMQTRDSQPPMAAACTAADVADDGYDVSVHHSILRRMRPIQVMLVQPDGGVLFVS